MFCNSCGTNLEETAKFCPACGAAVEDTPAPAEVAASAPVTHTPSPDQIEDRIPEEYQPLSPWAYFGLQILFAIPIVGFIFLVIFSINGSNLNRRNFARSYWCSLIIVGSVMLVVLILALLFTMGKRAF